MVQVVVEQVLQDSMVALLQLTMAHLEALV